MEETKNKDTLIGDLNIKLGLKDSMLFIAKEQLNIKDQQVVQCTKQTYNLTKENVKLQKYKNLVWYLVPIIVGETLIIIFK